MIPALLLWATAYAATITAACFLVGVAIAYQHIPCKIPPGLDQIFFHYRKGFVPEREIFFYALVIVAATAFFTMLIHFLKKRNKESWERLLWGYNIIQSCWFTLMVCCVIMIVNNPALAGAHTLLIISVVLALMTLVGLIWRGEQGYPRVSFILPKQADVQEKPFDRLDIVFLGLIAAIIIVVAPEAVAAQLFLGDYYHSWDVVFMGTVYGMFKGLIPCIDMNATYGLGMTAMIKNAMSMMGALVTPLQW